MLSGAAGRDRLVEWMTALGLEVRVDRIGNLFGTLRSPSDGGEQAEADGEQGGAAHVLSLL